jgi:hypothetical protein
MPFVVFATPTRKPHVLSRGRAAILVGLGGQRHERPLRQNSRGCRVPQGWGEKAGLGFEIPTKNSAKNRVIARNGRKGRKHQMFVSLQLFDSRRISGAPKGIACDSIKRTYVHGATPPLKRNWTCMELTLVRPVHFLRLSMTDWKRVNTEFGSIALYPSRFSVVSPAFSLPVRSSEMFHSNHPVLNYCIALKRKTIKVARPRRRSCDRRAACLACVFFAGLGSMISARPVATEKAASAARGLGFAGLHVAQVTLAPR